MTSALSEKKLKHVSPQCQIFKQPKASVLNLKKLIGLLLLTVQVILPAQIQFRYLQRGQILALQKKGSYSGHVTLGNLAWEELVWCMENLKLCKEREIEQREPHLIIHTDTSTKDWGAYCKEFQRGGNGQRKRNIFT